MSSPARLVEGFKTFRDQNSSLLSKLALGQTPEILVVACCDSRVDPALIMNCAPGDLFVVRNVANLVPPLQNRGHYQGTCSALEFGVCHLKIKHIIVLGHEHCGGIKALMKGDMTHDNNAWFISEWMKIADRAREQVLCEYAEDDFDVQRRACELQSILCSLDNLMTFPWIKDAVDSGGISLHGWYFDIGRQNLLAYNQASKQFEEM